MKPSLLALIAAVSLARAASAAPDEKKVDFAKDVAPILKTSCLKCHSLDKKHPKKKGAGELRLDDKDLAFKGGKNGKVIVPGDAKDSLLFKLLAGPVTMPVPGEDEDKDIPPMPKAKRGHKFTPLSDAQVAVIRDWIDQGADWPGAK